MSSSFSRSFIFSYVRRSLSLLCVFVFVGVLAFASAPLTKAADGINAELNYQAKLLDDAGVAVPDGVYNLKLSIYDSASGGTRLWTAKGTTGTPTSLAVTTTGGLLTVALGDTSSEGGSQNALDNSINWNSDTLYLGITVGSDAEMTPRRRLTSVAQAFNSQQLQGMSASGTAFGGDDLFTVFQTNGDSATDTRSALTIRTNGQSNSNDFLLRGLDNVGSTIFTLNRQGNIATNGTLSVQSGTTSTFSFGVSIPRISSGAFLNSLGDTTLGQSSANTVTVNGVINTSLVPTGVQSLGSALSYWDNGYITTLNSVGIDTTNIVASNVTTTNATTTYFFATNASTTNATSVNLFANTFHTDTGTITRLIVPGTMAMNGDISLGDSPSDAISVNGHITTDVVPSSNASHSLGTSILAWLNGYFTNLFATNVSSTNVSSTREATQTVSSTNILATNTTSTNVYATNATTTYLTALGNAIFNGDVALGSDTLDKVVVNGYLMSDLLPGGSFSLGSQPSSWLNGFFTNVSSTNASTTNFAAQSVSSTNILATNTTSTNVTTTNLGVIGSSAFNGDVSLGDSSGDKIYANGRVDTDLIGGPSVNLGSQALPWGELYANNVSSTVVTSTNSYVVNASTTNATTSNLFVSNSSSTNATTTYLFANYASTTNATTTRFFAAYTTTTHLNADEVSSTAVTTTSLGVHGGITNLLDSSSNLRIVATTSTAAYDQPRGMIVSGKYFITTFPTLGTANIYDATNPAVPKFIRTIAIGAGTSSDEAGMVVTGQYLYLLNRHDQKLGIIDLQNLAAPEVGDLTLPDYPSNIAVSGRYAYVGGSVSNVLMTVDVGDPAHPKMVYSVATPGVVGKVAVAGHYLFASDYVGGNIVIFDIRNPSHPVFVGTHSTPAGTYNIVTQGNYLYTAGPAGTLLTTIDISDVTGLANINHDLGFDVAAGGMTISGRYLYLTDTGTGLHVIDISNPSSPIEVTSLTLPDGGHEGLAVSGHYAYIANGPDFSINIVDVLGVETSGLAAASVEAGTLQVLSDGRIANSLSVGSAINVGDGGIFSAGALGVNATNTTSTILGNLSVGTSTYDIAISNPLFQMNGNDLLVGGMMGSVSSVYSNGAFVAGGGTFLADGIVARNDGDLSLDASTGYILPVSDSVTHLGSEALRFDGYFSDATTTNATTSFLSVLNNASVNGQTFLNGTVNLGVSNGNKIIFNGSVYSDILPYTSDSFSLGNGASEWLNGFFFNVSSTNASTTWLASQMVSSTNGLFTNVTGTNIFSTDVTSTNIFSTNVTSSNFMTTYATATNAYFGTATATTFAWVNASGTYTTSSYLNVTNNIDNTAKATTAMTIKGSQLLNGGSDIQIAGKMAYVADGFGLQTVDVSNPASPTTTGYINLSGAYGVTVSGKYAYVADNVHNAVYVVDVSRPALPELVATMSITSPTDLEVAGGYLYVTSYSTGFIEVMDVTDPLNPSIAGSLDTTTLGGHPISLAVEGKYLYVLDTAGPKLGKVDISNPLVPTIVSNIVVNGVPDTVRVQNGYAYVDSNGGAGRRMEIFNETSVTSTWKTGYYTTSNSVAGNGLVVNGRYAYIITIDGKLTMVDVQDPTAPTAVTSLTIPWGPSIQGLAVAGRYAYVGTNSTPGMQIVDTTGLETTGLMAHSADVGDLQVEGGAYVDKALSVGDALTVGDGGIQSGGVIAGYTSSTGVGARFVNGAAPYNNSGWGTYTNELLVGNNESTTGTQDFSMVITYDGFTKTGLCIDDTNTLASCSVSAGASIQADGAINASAFDLAERYRVSGDVTSSDVLVFDTDATATMKVSPGVAYDPHLAGVASTKPGFLLGSGLDTSVALAGRVPTKVSTINGPIAVGDLLTTSPIPGVAMKATKPGMTLGYALEPASTTSTIEVFIKVGYSALGLLNTDGSVAEMTDDLVVTPTSTATALQPAVDSFGLTFRGSAWDGTTAITSDFRLINDVSSADQSALTVLGNDHASLFSIDQHGNTQIGGDLVVSGKIFPATRSGAQTHTYMFLDDSVGTSTYIATNADGWQANDSYDFAERYYSPDALEAGDLVAISETGQSHVQRAWTDHQMLLGIVSTRPGFVAGAPATSTYPIALSGRVPTKVSTMKGAIKAGDPLAASSIPGVAVKAIGAGSVVGEALEDYDAASIGTIEVYVNPSWWGGLPADAPVVAAPVVPTSTPEALNARGLALMLSGATKVHVAFASLNGYPNIQVTPYADVDGGWWIDKVTDHGFDVLFKQAQNRDVSMSWTAIALNTDERVYQSDGTSVSVDPTTGVIISNTAVTTTIETAPVPPIAPPVVVATTPAAPVTPDPVTTPTENTATPTSTDDATSSTVTTPAPVATTTDVTGVSSSTGATDATSTPVATDTATTSVAVGE